jgi:hypothetical protein
MLVLKMINYVLKTYYKVANPIKAYVSGRASAVALGSTAGNAESPGMEFTFDQSTPPDIVEKFTRAASIAQEINAEVVPKEFFIDSGSVYSESARSGFSTEANDEFYTDEVLQFKHVPSMMQLTQKMFEISSKKDAGQDTMLEEADAQTYLKHLKEGGVGKISQETLTESAKLNGINEAQMEWAMVGSAKILETAAPGSFADDVLTMSKPSEC